MESSERTTYQHYEVERLPGGALHELGRGAMGITYKALDSNLRVPVALKVITGALLPDARARTRFMREARAAAQLRHSNVATVYHLGQEADFCFYTMEFIDGETCEAHVHRNGPLDPATALRICSQVARALQAAHSRGLLHRDLKPANLMVAREDGDLLVKVIDFGLVKPLQPDDGDAGASLSGGLFLGTPLYASPEQCASEETLDGRSDLYSLGATLWFLLTGQPLFKGSMRSVMAQHLTKPPPVEVLRGQPPAVTGLLHELLAKDPADRPADAGVLRVRIAEILRELETPDDPDRPPAPLAVSAPEVVFTLEDVLRKRGCLPAGEVALLLPPLAALFDAVAHDQPAPDLTPRNVQAAFTAGETVADTPDFPALPLDEWPPFTLRIGAAQSAVTLAQAPSDATLIQSQRHAPGTPVESVARLLYELLDGSPPASNRHYRPLTALTESANDALRGGFSHEPVSGAAGVREFCAGLKRALEGGSTTAIPAGLKDEVSSSPSPPTMVAEAEGTPLAPPRPDPVRLERIRPRQWLMPATVVASLIAVAVLSVVWKTVVHHNDGPVAAVSASDPSPPPRPPATPADSRGYATATPTLAAETPASPAATPPAPAPPSGTEPPSTPPAFKAGTPYTSAPEPTPKPSRRPSVAAVPAPDTRAASKPTRKSVTVVTPDANPKKANPVKPSVRDLQRKAIEQQHQRGLLSDGEYRQAIKGLGN